MAISLCCNLSTSWQLKKKGLKMIQAISFLFRGTLYLVTISTMEDFWLFSSIFIMIRVEDSTMTTLFLTARCQKQKIQLHIFFWRNTEVFFFFSCSCSFKVMCFLWMNGAFLLGND